MRIAVLACFATEEMLELVGLASYHGADDINLQVKLCSIRSVEETCQEPRLFVDRQARISHVLRMTSERAVELWVGPRQGQADAGRLRIGQWRGAGMPGEGSGERPEKTGTDA